MASYQPSSSTIAKILPAVGIGAVPLTALQLVKGSLALDGLHIILIELVFLCLTYATVAWTRNFGKVEEKSLESRGHDIKLSPRTVLLKEPAQQTTPQTVKDNAVLQDPDRSSSEKVVAADNLPLYENELYPSELLDSTVYRLLELVDPESLTLLDSAANSANAEPRLRFEDWNNIHKDEFVSVAKNPNAIGMYAITTRFPTLPLRSLWEFISAMELRSSWDSMCEATAVLERLGIWPPAEGAHESRQATVDYMALRSMFPVKAKDMVLVTAVGRLPPTDKGLRRLIRATKSVEHPSKPAQKGYQRMELIISGFLIQDDGTGGCVMTQVTDVSSLGSWVPTKIINLVTTKLIPKSLQKMGEAAATAPYPAERQHLTENQWLPPPVQVYSQKKQSMREDTESQRASQSAAESRAASNLVKQLRILETRIGELEKGQSSPPVRSTSVMKERPWYLSMLYFLTFRKPPDVRNGTVAKRQAADSGGDLGLIIRTTLSGAFGGVLGSAALVAMFLAWQRRGR